ncbi:MAG: DUF4174 domain-containing protein [Drouetiella hepatica Uher 2000/2452]|jgi:hypothetical protein|uniref:DUF4174 domain-containing protein n=1 Tax=Drouetiella hepatica Uher 2000/2452 TaxID=904376 RepID=A0A951UQR6_9CYAN|nr:DUF4174 domain-containing protein [Drouetiella hepatica Uher 2000/2452]
MQRLVAIGSVLLLSSACSNPQTIPMSNDFLNTSVPLAASVINSVATSTQPDVTFNLSDEQWQHRILLIFAPSEQSPLYQKQQQAWQSRSEGMQERDLKLVEVLATGASQVNGQPMSAASADRLRDQFGVAPQDFAVILVGKDGTEKQRFSQPVDLSDIFSTIDAMPMRQQEMR